MNSHTTQITGLSEISEPLEIGKNYEVLITADCNSITKLNNEDGSFTYKYRLKQLTAEIKKDNGQVIKAKVKGRTKSKLLRDVLFVEWEQLNDKSLDSESYYNREMDLIIDSRRKNLE